MSQQKCCQRWPMTQHTPAEHQGAHCKQDLCHWAASLWEQGFHHRPTGDPLQNCRKASDSNFSLAGSVLGRNHGLAICWWLQLPTCYNKPSSDSGSLDSWATSNNLGLLYDAKEPMEHQHKPGHFAPTISTRRRNRSRNDERKLLTDFSHTSCKA